MPGLTLSRYIFIRFCATVGAGIGAILLLIYLIDFIEMFRRASGAVAVGAASAAFLSLLRAPSIAEQAMPFVVLASAMFAFFNLSRRMELIVARAAGVSAWQFLTPALVATALLGVFIVVAYNPAAAAMKEQADRLETELFGGPKRETDTSLWFRQRGVPLVSADGGLLGGDEFQRLFAVGCAAAFSRPLADAQGGARRVQPRIGGVEIGGDQYFANLCAVRRGKARVGQQAGQHFGRGGQLDLGLDAHAEAFAFSVLLCAPAGCRWGGCATKPGRRL